MEIQSRELAICSCSYVRHSFRVTEMNESSEVKAFVRNANNLSGRSIKRNLQCHKRPSLYSTWVDSMDVESVPLGRRLFISGEEIASCTYWIHWHMECDMIRKSHLSKLGRSYSQSIPFRMTKSRCITPMWGKQWKAVRATDEPVVATTDMDNITYPSEGTLGANSKE